MIRSLFAVSLAAIACSAHAGEPEARAGIATLVPDAQIESITAAPIPGFFEVLIKGQIVYISDNGRYLLQGTLFDIQDRVDLTENSRAELRRSVLKEIKPDSTINYGPAKPKHAVTVFTDIDCGYCRRMHAEMAQYNELGIRVDYLFFPRAGAGSESWQKAVSVWCSDDRQQALTDAKAGKPIDRKECSNPIEQDYLLGHRMGVTGTPMVFAADGSQLGGYLAPEQLLQRLDQLAAQKRD